MICEEPERVKKQVSIHQDAYSAAEGTHALVLCTEWDEFIVSIYFEEKKLTFMAN